MSELCVRFHLTSPSWTSSNGLQRDDFVSRATAPVRGCSGALLREFTPKSYSMPYHRSFYQDGLLCKVARLRSSETHRTWVPYILKPLHHLISQFFPQILYSYYSYINLYFLKTVILLTQKIHLLRLHKSMMVQLTKIKHLKKLGIQTIFQLQF